MNHRKHRGINITKLKNQIYRIDDSTYKVRSQTTPDIKYTLVRTTYSWDCDCPDDTTYCKHAYALEELLGMKARADRGRMIHEMGGQVECITPDHYLVKSQSRNETYEICDFGNGWMCSCPDHIYTGVTCKHIQAVQWSTGERRVIRPHDHTRCKFCDSVNIIKKGMRGTKQQYGCKTCGRRFIQNLGFEYKHTTPDHICMGVGMLYGGMSTRKVATVLSGKNVNVSHQTVLNWAESYGVMMEQFLDQIIPLVGEDWRTDEIYMKIRGERKYLFAMLDSDTRYWIAKQVATHKGTDDVRPMFKKSREIAGKVPSRLISDGASNFAEAHKDEYVPEGKDTVHEPHIHLDGDHNNNQMESFNGNTIRYREDATRGLKRDDSSILCGLQTYHNHIRPHQGLPAHMTPGEMAGITIRGKNKLKTLIEAAAKTNRE